MEIKQRLREVVHFIILVGVLGACNDACKSPQKSMLRSLQQDRIPAVQSCMKALQNESTTELRGEYLILNLEACCTSLGFEYQTPLKDSPVGICLDKTKGEGHE